MIFMNIYSFWDKRGLFCLGILALTSQLSIAACSIAIGLGSIFLFFDKEARRRIFAQDTRLIVFGIVSFIVLLSFSNLFSNDVLDSQKRLLAHILRWLPFFLVLGYVRTAKEWWGIVVLLFCSTALASGVGIYQHYNGMERVIGLEKNPIYYAAEVLAVSIVGLYMLFMFKKNETRISDWLLIGAFLALTMVAIGFSQTRGAWFSLVITIVTCLVLERKRFNKKKLLKVFALFVLFLAIFGMLNFNYMHRLTNFTDVNSIERIYLWKSAWAMFVDYPFAGVGMGQFHGYYVSTYKVAGAINNQLIHPHNSVLTFLSENGILGGLGFVFLFGSILVAASKQMMLTPVMGVAILETVCFLIGAMTDHLFTALILMRTYWLVIGLAIAGGRVGVFGKRLS